MMPVDDRGGAEQLRELGEVGHDGRQIGKEHALSGHRGPAVGSGRLEEQPRAAISHRRDRDAVLHRVSHRLPYPGHQRFDHRSGERDVHDLVALGGRLQQAGTLCLDHHGAVTLADGKQVIDVAGRRGRLRENRFMAPVQDVEQEAVEHLQPSVAFVRLQPGDLWSSGSILSRRSYARSIEFPIQSPRLGRPKVTAGRLGRPRSRIL